MAGFRLGLILMGKTSLSPQAIQAKVPGLETVLDKNQVSSCFVAPRDFKLSISQAATLLCEEVPNLAEDMMEFALHFSYSNLKIDELIPGPPGS